ncbi:hypothetical protein [Rhodopirellula sp. P2]|uniref:hypothetical protein n=1 Tax=Rhodopirellula sp. P2 TaxID=2127060 RepID=UPI002367E277|nr:hypothetical protein [Rhodopirellula sp. P2]WDQ18219.1 hypothetical protein PSR62_06630 [Rhodopirellula sp. P2]
MLFRSSERVFITTPMRCCWTICALAVTLTLGTGCSLFQNGVWSDGPLDESRSGSKHTQVSKLTHKSRNTISLQADFRHVSTQDLDESLWQHVDETAFPPKIREAWLANGFRIGLIATPDALPETAEDNLAANDDPINRLLSTAGVLGRSPSGVETIPLRSSQRHELPVSPVLDGSHVVLAQESGKLTGRSLDSPQMSLSLTPTLGPGPGQATLEIRPEIQHGSVQQRFISSEAATRLATGRSTWELPEMNLSWVANPHLTLLIAPVHQPDETEPTFGLARQMLRDADHLQDDQHVILLLRVDDLPSS